MRIFSKSTLTSFWRTHADSEQPLKVWFKLCSNADWSEPSEISDLFSGISLLKDQRVCFNIKGNDYRLIAKVNYEYKSVFVLFIGSHAEYDKIDANTI